MVLWFLAAALLPLPDLILRGVPRLDRSLVLSLAIPVHPSCTPRREGALEFGNSSSKFLFPCVAVGVWSIPFHPFSSGLRSTVPPPGGRRCVERLVQGWGGRIPERASCPRRDTLTLYLIQVSRCVRKFSAPKPLLRVRNIFPFQGSWLLASVTCRSKEDFCRWIGKYAFTSQAWPSWFLTSVIITATFNVI